ncbi:hypothetical protein LZP69_01035 [Shewanella sp. AS1]|uniref:hypothetical protein n=1 Tax=Shewanella sp. AS1 TaxID=2907626 RepID=UPI001F47E73A|nr:hypothetical protein [Shewanella sp. AS1]MCE9677775.1 hypothetical protein [Shewanella sp. AS1]
MFTSLSKKRRRVLAGVGTLAISASVAAGLQLFKGQAEQLKLDCQAQSFEVDAEQLSQILLKIASLNDKVTFNYQFVEDGSVKSSAKLSGTLQKLDMVNMGYNLTVDSAEVDADLDDWVAADIADIINYAKQTIELGQEVLFDVKVVAMEIEKGYAVLHFCPGNSLWVCKLD